jgi:hypothetical protein
MDPFRDTLKWSDVLGWVLIVIIKMKYYHTIYAYDLLYCLFSIHQ